MKRSFYSIATAASVLLLAAGMTTCAGASGSSPTPIPTQTPTQAKWASVKYGGGYVPGLNQYGGIANLAADQSVTGRLFVSGSDRGVLYSY
jgi:hypothetical protein